MKAKPFRTEIRMIEIYLIHSPETNEVFVGKVRHPNSYQAYKDHVRGQKSPTKEFFQRVKETGNYPKMYLLELLETTETDAYGHLIVWTRYFSDAGFTVLAHKKNLDFSAELTEKNQKIFEEIKEIPLEKILSEDKILVKSYTPKSKKREVSEAKPRQISIFVTPEEYEILAQRAAQEHTSMSKYCKRMALDGCILRLETYKYSEEIRLLKDAMRGIMIAILQTGKYYPDDVDRIQKQVDKLTKHHKKMVDQLFKKVDKFQKNRLRLK